MAFDGIVTRAIVNELNCIIESKIDKIHMPDKNTIIIGLYGYGKHYNLNICIDSHNCRINLTNHSRQNPLVAPNFCMLLRKHLLGGIVSNIKMFGLERIVNIDIQTINEFNEIETKTLVVELMGKHSNIILLNKDNIIIDSMRHIDSANSYREILPSRHYTLPFSDKFDFMNLKSFEEFQAKISNYNNDDLANSISNAFTGFSLSFVKTSIEKCNGSLPVLYDYFCRIIYNFSNLGFELLYKNNIAKDYSLVESNSISNDLSLNSFIDDFYFERETTERFTNYRNSILKLILDILKKYNSRLVSINSKLSECNDMDKYKLYGELLTANLYRLNNYHLDSVEIENYYDNNNLISIPLDIKYSPSVNAKMYFKKYSKLKNALKIVTEQKHETEKEIDYIGSIIYELENSSSLEDVEAIFEEISENVIFKDKLNNNNKKKKVSKKAKKKVTYNPIKYEVDGYTVFVGRNNLENDWLTLSFANKKDIWFHVKDIHGSHVILKADLSEVADSTLVKCAEIAARHSKANLSSNVPVDYCLVQFVKKPNGAKPGMVIFTNNKTLNVNP